MKLEEIQEVYEHLGDDISKELYRCRVLYSITGETKYMVEMARTNEILKEFFTCLSNHSGQVAIMGAGYRGEQLAKIHNDIKYKCFIDRNPKVDFIEGIPVIKTSEFLKNHVGQEIVVISSRIYEKEMYEELLEGGIKEECILNYGNILEKINENQYFDLSELSFCEHEIFVDLGCFDAMTDLQLKKRIGDKLDFVIAFEPDGNRIDKCCQNLDKEKIKYNLIPKGAWSDERTLHFEMAVSGMLTIGNAGQTVEVTSVDKVLEGKRATFIKMDIEGAELEALKGSRKTIQIYKPKLAICVYHKLDDIFNIPVEILNYCRDYKFYLRHYSPYCMETVLYAIPQK